MPRAGASRTTYIEEAHEGVISNEKAEHGATLVAEYKGIRFYDKDAGEGSYYRIRADLCSWADKRRGGWLATCGEMPSGGPSEDPVEDIERPDEYDPEVYIINGTLHGMITAADQAPGVVVERVTRKKNRRRRRTK